MPAATFVSLAGARHFIFCINLSQLHTLADLRLFTMSQLFAQLSQV